MGAKKKKKTTYTEQSEGIRFHQNTALQTQQWSILADLVSGIYALKMFQVDACQYYSHPFFKVVIAAYKKMSSHRLSPNSGSPCGLPLPGSKSYSVRLLLFRDS